MSSSSRVTRRDFISYGATATTGVLVGASSATAATMLTSQDKEVTVADAAVTFFGPRQSGIETPQQSFGAFVGFTLNAESDRASIARLLRVWTSDISLLMSGQPAMGDAAPELASRPFRLTVTVGVAMSAFERAGVADKFPESIGQLPSYEIDKLEERWSGGDVVIQLCADDRLPIAHAMRELIKSADPFAKPKWVQQGFMQHSSDGQSPRNLMGQVDGTDNPKPNSNDFAATVWNQGETQPWFENGSVLVLRRIRMALDTWERLSPRMQEEVIGRKRSNGAPLTGVLETDPPDLLARRDDRFVIAEDAHIRRASTGRNILRRVYNFDDGVDADGSNVGLLFASYQAQLAQFVEIQERLAAVDALNAWTTPVGSAVFAILPGTEEGQWLGQSVFD